MVWTLQKNQKNLVSVLCGWGTRMKKFTSFGPRPKPLKVPTCPQNSPGEDHSESRAGLGGRGWERKRSPSDSWISE